MTKCDFCTEYNPKKKKCFWGTSSTLKYDDCEKAIHLMVKALKKEKKRKK